MISDELQAKYDSLKREIKEMERLAVAFSAGVDSTFLLSVAHEVLGDDVVAFTAVSPANPKRETDAAARFCEQRGIRCVSFHVNELDLPGFDCNPENRCYLCKRHLFTLIADLARDEDIAYVAEGSNVDDVGDYRPGRQAIEELAIRSPLLECGLTKQDIRDLSRRAGLPTWDKPSLACLYSRFAYGDMLTIDKLERVDGAERFLLDRGFKTVRVRMMGESARIEVAPDDIARLAEPSMREAVVDAFKVLGFAYTTVDLQGYRTGSMNETLTSRDSVG